MLKFLLFLIIFLVIKTKAAKILCVIPNHSRSHQQVYKPIFKELAKRGHELVLLTTLPMNDENLLNIREITWHGTYEAIANLPNIKEIYMDQSLSGLKSAFLLSNQLIKIHNWQLEDERVQALIKNKSEHFDLVMIEFFSPIMFAFKHRFNAPFIGLLSMDMLNLHQEAVGNPIHYFLYPDRILTFQGDMPFYSRVIGIIHAYTVKIFLTLLHYGENLSVQKYFGNNYLPIEQLETTVDMLFINSNPAFYKARPVTPATINIYGLHIGQPKPLPKVLRKFLDESKRGVIYFSLGSNVHVEFLPPNLLILIKNTFRELPYDILWKYENDTMGDQPENVLIQKWIPQQGVLAHSNIKLFITQCGLQSLEEGLHFQVPMLGFPIMYDQWINSNYLAKRGFGIALDYRTITQSDFKNAILSIILNSSSHKANLKKWSDIVMDTPNTSLERAIFWTEYVIRHNGSQHLKGIFDIPLYQYYYLDIILFISVFLVGLILMMYKVIRLSMKYFSFKRKGKKLKTN